MENEEMNQELEAGYEFTKAQIAELESLRIKNAVLSARIKRIESSPTIEACKQMIESKCAEENAMLYQKIAGQAAVIERLRDVLEITHELYVQSSSGYGFATPDNPHNYMPDIESCNAEEIRNHSKACSDYDAGLPIVNRQWGIGTYCDEFKPAIEALAIPTDSKQVLHEWLDKVLGDPILMMNSVGNTEPVFKTLPRSSGFDVPLFKKPEIK